MPSKAATDRFVASMCRESFYQFFLGFWSLTAAEKLRPSWYIKCLCDELQVLSERVFRDEPKEYDFIFNCPPGTSKSSIVSILWQPWIWTRMPSARFISGSYSERLALDHSRKSRDVITSEKYQRLFGPIELREDQNTKGYFANTFGGIRYAVGVGGSVIGMHAHFISVDDPIDPQGVLSDLILAEANSWMAETLSRRKVDVMLTPTALIMQRLHQNDPTGSMLERGTRVKHFILPGDTSWEVKPESLKDFYEDELLDPVRLPRPALEEAFITLGETGYAGQYGQAPTPRGGAKFKIDRLQFRTTAPVKWARGPVRFWDKAASFRSGAYTVGFKAAEDEDGKIWILDVKRDQLDSGRREKWILETARQDGKKVRIGIEQEPGGGGKTCAEATIRMLSKEGFRCIADKAVVDKELRADVFSQRVNLGDVIVLIAPWNRTLTEEMRFFPVSKYKDQVDAGSGAVNMLVKPRLKIGTMR